MKTSRLTTLLLALSMALLCAPALAEPSPDALFKAAESGNVTAIRKALTQGISVNAIDADGWNALIIASGEGKLQAVQALVKAGADVNSASKRGETALMAAVLSGNIAVVKYLLSEGADKTAVTTKGLTAADIAGQAKKPEIAKLLAPAGNKAQAAKTAPPKAAVSKNVATKENAAVEAFQKGRYDEATTLFKELVTLDPKNALAWHFLGQAQEKRGDMPSAKAAYAKSLEIQPTGEVAERTKSFLSRMPGEKDCADCPEMVTLPAGNFNMGSNNGDSDEKPAHKVSVAAFAMSKYEVTQGQWKAIMGSNPSELKNCGDNCPVENVSWNDVQEFIRKLNAKTGKQYRLPSEAEWEYACRAGAQQEYCGSDNIDAVAWYGAYADPKGNSARTTNRVGQRQANAWGLYDMSGNVWEWVEDSYHDSYNGAPSDGSVWQGDGAKRVLRGGSWDFDPQDARAANRRWNDPAYRFNVIGFRLARTLP